MSISQTEAQALAAFVTRVRPDWDTPGIIAAIAKAKQLGSALDVAHALLTLAENRDLTSPGLLSQPGKHWTRPTGEQTGPNVSHNVRCPEHPINFHPCPLCAAKKCTPDPEKHADYLAEKAKLRASRPRHDLTPVSKPIVPLLTDEERDQARQLLPEQEANA